MHILITGCAGFIGFHLARTRLKQGDTIIGIDNLNDYYTPTLKKSRLERLSAFAGFTFYQEDITAPNCIMNICKMHKPEIIIHLAAQAGVRYSLTHPHAYTKANVEGFLAVLEAARHNDIAHVIYASSSSVYGANNICPSREDANTDCPLTIYAASKKANELMAFSYQHLYGFAATGLRFFTVYGPWGRPDMAFFSFTRDIIEGNPIKIYNFGNMRRDFTYIDDAIAALEAIIENGVIQESPAARVYNVGNGNPVNLLAYVNAIEDVLGIEANKEFLPLQPGDVLATHADISKITQDYGYKPGIRINEGIKRFVTWYREHYATSEFNFNS